MGSTTHWPGCHHPTEAVLRQGAIALALACAARTPPQGGCSDIGEDGGYSSRAREFLHTGHAEDTYGQQKKILTTFTKKQQEQFWYFLHHPYLLDLAPAGFSPSIGTTTRAADPPHRPCFEPDRLEGPSQTAFLWDLVL